MPKTEEKVFLIVDRSGVHQKMLGRLVESVGGRAVSVRDYDEARVTLRNIQPEAIILDIRSDTQEVELFLDSLSSERRTPVPVIAVCNVVDQGLVQTLNKYGVAEILVKPIVIQRLHRAIQNIFHDRRPGQDTDETETSPTILLIEDFTITAKSYASVLERAGYQILLARTAEIAYELVVRHHPDFMLLDVILPGMNGVEFAQLLQSRRLEIPFAAVTVCKDQSKLHELQRLGALKIFHKPVEGEALLGFVNGFFSSQRGRSHEDISYDVLLAIPDQVAGNIVRQALDEVGIRHKLVTDGYQAFAELQLCPAIAVIDIVLGGLDGAEIIRRLR
ncbi:response regulator, partial [bacterium]|nr:response regulator [bacterium]